MWKIGVKYFCVINVKLQALLILHAVLNWQMFQPVAGDFTLAWKQARTVSMVLLVSFCIKLSPELDNFCLNPFVVFSAARFFKKKKVTVLQRMEKEFLKSILTLQLDQQNPCLSWVGMRIYKNFLTPMPLTILLIHSLFNDSFTGSWVSVWKG